jgi:uncharacterized protein (TIGR00297 family)
LSTAFDPVRLLAGLALSAAIAGAALRTRALSRSGAVAGVLVATACTAAGWSWAWLLILFFAASVGLSNVGRSIKRVRLDDVVAKGGARDAWQVLANGGVFATLAIISMNSPSALVYAAAAGALAASTADTWATEIGALSRAMPRSILSLERVAPGTSGGVTVLGIFASLAGAAFIGAAALLLDWPTAAMCAAIAGGFGGSIIDSILGATVQKRCWCERCGRGTERAVHACGMQTTHAGGLRWLDNDLVNFFSSVSGALLGSLCLR